MVDPYEVLGVSRDADSLTIRRAYQKLARRWHPALHAGNPRAERSFKAAAQAYALLSDVRARRAWAEGAARPRSAQVKHRVRRAKLTAPDLVYRFEELVLELLPAESPEPIDGGEAAEVDLQSEVGLDFAEAIRGVVVSLSVQRESVCEECAGAGCEPCEGRGFEVHLERVRVRIPPGVGDGSRVRVRDQGNAGLAGQGDLYVVIRVRPHDYFSRRGSDIFAKVPITVAEASLGASVRVPTIDGPVEVRIPPGTRSGQRFRLVDKGVAAVDGTKGDHYYQTEIVPPSAETGNNRKLLGELEQLDPRLDLPAERL